MRLCGTVEIRASPGVVFDVVSTPERLPAWNPSVAHAARLGRGPIGLGSRARVVGRAFGQELESETEVVAFDPPRAFATRAVRGPRLSTTFRLEPVACGTRVSLDVSGDVPGGRLGGRLAERLLRGEFVRALEQLGSLCEEQARRTAATEPLEGVDPPCWAHELPEAPAHD